MPHLFAVPLLGSRVRSARAKKIHGAARKRSSARVVGR
jgi:hypothetical protein